MFSQSQTNSLKRRFSVEIEENTEILEPEKTHKKKKSSPIGIDELHNCDSPISFPKKQISNDPPILNEEHSYASEDLEDSAELNNSSSNSLEVYCPLATHKAGFFDVSTYDRNIESLPCSAHVYDQVRHYSERLNENKFLRADVHQNISGFLSAIQQNLFLEYDDFMLMEFFNAVNVFFENYIDNLETSIWIQEFQLEQLYSDLEHLKYKLNESFVIGFPLEEKDFFVPNLR